MTIPRKNRDSSIEREDTSRHEWSSPSPGSRGFTDTSPRECGQLQPYFLKDLGWTVELTRAFGKYDGRYVPGRVACRQKTAWEVFTNGGSVMAGISGALRRIGSFPAVGDFVVLFPGPGGGTSTIVDILPQKTRITRGSSGREGTDQVIAANIDQVFIVTAAGRDLNVRRIERYLAITHASGARPVIVINKSDLVPDAALLTAEILPVSPGIPVIAVSALSGEGLDRLGEYLLPGTTIALLGSSGVGKSSLINRLLDRPVQVTSAIRDYDGKGRHTTTVRQLFVLKSGALMIDTPGLREVGIGTASAGIPETFPDILELAGGCRFRDCSHTEEPGCVVQAAVRNGILSPARLENYRRLARELAFEEQKAEIGLARLEKKRWKGIAKAIRRMNDGGGG
jgi:ribosome biogenesis GTPase